MKMLKCTSMLLLCLFFSLLTYAQRLSQKAYLPSFSEGKIRSFFKDIRKKTGVEISFSESVLDSRQKVKLRGSEHTVEEALTTILAGFPVTWMERPDKILIIPSASSGITSPPQVEKITLSGFIRDSFSSEVLIGATIYIPATGAGTFTNAYGFYSLTIPAGQYDMAVSYIGYKKKVLTTGGGKRDVQLSVDDGMEEVSVVVKKEKPSDHVQLTQQSINKYAVPLGDNDVMRALQHYPGVQPSNDGTVSMNVRGGDPSQNLCMLDGVPVYHVDHVVSISSIYNTEALKTTDFYTGGFPARYGGRLSSVIDVYTRDGDMEHFGGSAKLGLMNGSASLEGPLVKNKVSMIVSGRRSWADLVQKLLDTTDVKFNFYDVNAKVNYQMNASNRFYVSLYKGQDRLGTADNDDPGAFVFNVKWGNTFVAAKWTTVWHPKVFVNTTATFSDFKYEMTAPIYLDDSAGTYASSKGISVIKETALKSQLSWYASASHKVEAGLQYAHATFDPGAMTFEDGVKIQINTLSPAERVVSNEIVAFAEDEWKPLPRLKIRTGLHMAYWVNDKFSYPVLQPRLHASYKLAQTLHLYGSVTRMAQFLHRIGNNPLGFPSDFWLPSTAVIKPESSLLGNLGLRSQTEKGLQFSVEVYYTRLYNLIANTGTNNFFADANQWESRIAQGKGKSYGLECSVERQFGKIALAAVYTLSKSERQFDALFDGATVPYKYDRRHNLHLNGIWQLSPSVNFTASWTYMSGSFITLPDQEYPDPDNNILNNTWNFSSVTNYTDRNNYRLPSIHRLDMAVNFTRKKRQRYERTLTIGIFNAYGRKNILGAFLTHDEVTETYKLETISIGRFVPTLSYRIQF